MKLNVKPFARTRFLLVVVALSAVLTYGWILRGKSIDFARRAARHKSLASVHKTNIASVSGMKGRMERAHPEMDLSEYDREIAELKKAEAAEHELSRYYKNASRFPWMY